MDCSRDPSCEEPEGGWGGYSGYDAQQEPAMLLKQQAPHGLQQRQLELELFSVPPRPPAAAEAYRRARDQQGRERDVALRVCT